MSGRRHAASDAVRRWKARLGARLRAWRKRSNGIRVGQEVCHCRPSARSGAPDARTADRSRSAQRGSRSGRRVTLRDRGRLHRHDARVRQRVDLLRLQHMRKELRAVAHAGRAVLASRMPCARSSASTAACWARYCATHNASARSETSCPRESPISITRLRLVAARRPPRSRAAPHRARAPRAARTFPLQSGRQSQVRPPARRPSQPVAIDRFRRSHTGTQVGAEAAAESASQLPSTAAQSGAGLPASRAASRSCIVSHPRREGRRFARGRARSKRRTASALSESSSTWPAAARASAPKTAATAAASRGVELVLVRAPFR